MWRERLCSAKTRYVKGWIGVLMTEDSSFHCGAEPERPRSAQRIVRSGGYETLTSICFGLASSAVGRTRLRTPSLYSAEILLESTVLGRLRDLLKFP